MTKKIQNNYLPQIEELLKERACLKQAIYRQTLEQFKALKTIAKDIILQLKERFGESDPSLILEYTDLGEFEAQIKFGGDILVFTMHTNIFNFPEEHPLMKSPYIQEQSNRSYCGEINIYNFLSDSFKYQRLHDIGYLIGRIFINKENHFIVEGKRQLGFLYQDMGKLEMNEIYMRAIIEGSILYAIDFDLLVPGFDHIKEMTVHEKTQQQGMASIRTGKRLGFVFESKTDIKD